MTKRMLIDATHAEETRVVVLDGNRLAEYDVETAARKQLKGNIYLAKVVRVEPSLQAAFVKYSDGRDGFLAFGEIHPDYYQIPVADRQRLVELQEQEAREDDEEDRPAPQADAAPSPDPAEPHEAEPVARALRVDADEALAEFPVDAAPETGLDTDADAATSFPEPEGEPASQPEMLGGEHDTSDDAARERRSAARFLRHYKIQEVIRRRQILLVQVTKEERGGKGAALTTYISLAGRYSVLMPNSPRGGGVSRKITSAADRRRLKEITAELDLPRGMAMIVRTAGASRPRPEIRRDGETLLTLWDDIRDTTLRSMAPCLIHEEASLVRRAIRDSYAGEAMDVIVDGEAGWRAARDTMRMMMPDHADRVQLWRGEGGNRQKLFGRYQVDSQLDAMLDPRVQLRSGGTLVINQTEALVAIDVNSGRSTRERGIEETALRTNLEAAEEVARQLRLRDLAGLIVIDFIDMESRRNNVAVERRLKDALGADRARIQVGSISAFGLLEMSRQRLRPSIAETSFVSCPHCGGTGHVRGIESAVLHVLRAVEDEGARRRSAEIAVHVASAVALYVLNHKRDRLGEIEARHAMRVGFAADETLLPPQLRIERLRAQTAPDAAPAAAREASPVFEAFDESAADSSGIVLDADMAPADDATRSVPAAGEASDEADKPRRRRRRRRGGKQDEAGAEAGVAAEDAAGADAASTEATNEDQPEAPKPARARAPGRSRIRAAPDRDAPVEEPIASPAENEPDRDAPNQDALDQDAPVGSEAGRRRGRRGGRRRRGEGREPDAARQAGTRSDSEETPGSRAVAGDDAQTAPQPPFAPASMAMPAHPGPTPADPFGGAFDIFDALEHAMEPPPPASAPEAAGPVEAVAFDDRDPTQVTAPEPLVPVPDAPKPILVGEVEPPPRKRGWWRR